MSGYFLEMCEHLSPILHNLLSCGKVNRNTNIALKGYNQFVITLGNETERKGTEWIASNLYLNLYETKRNETGYFRKSNSLFFWQLKQSGAVRTVSDKLDESHNYLFFSRTKNVKVAKNSAPKIAVRSECLRLICRNWFPNYLFFHRYCWFHDKSPQKQVLGLPS